MAQTTLPTKQKQTCRRREQACGCQGEGLGRGGCGALGLADAHYSMRKGQTARTYCGAHGTTLHILRYTTRVTSVGKNARVYVHLRRIAVGRKSAPHCKPAACVSAQLLSRVWLCDPMDCSLPGSSARRNFQARILESVAISYSTINYTPIR